MANEKPNDQPRWEPTRPSIGALVWLLMTLGLGTVLTYAGILTALEISEWDDSPDCHGFRQRPFPPQSWCPATTGELVASEPMWTQVGFVSLLGATLLAFALTVLLASRAGRGPRRWRLIVGIVVVVTIATALLAYQVVVADTLLAS